MTFNKAPKIRHQVEKAKFRAAEVIGQLWK